MALSNIAYAVPRATVATMLALGETNPTACRTAIVAAIKAKFPVAAATLTAADVAAFRVVVLDCPAQGFVGFGRGLADAQAAVTAAVAAAAP